jgi:hypothetical protein
MKVEKGARHVALGGARRVEGEDKGQIQCVKQTSRVSCPPIIQGLIG